MGNTSLTIVGISMSLCVLNVTLFPEVLLNTQLSTLFIITTSVVFGVWAFYKVFIYPEWVSPLRHLPKAKGAYPIIGHPQITLRKPAHDTFLRFVSENPGEGLIRVTNPFNQNAVLLTNPATLREVLSEKTYEFEKPPEIRKFLAIILGKGLIVVEGDEHKFQRKHATPAFSFRHIKELYPIFWQKAVDLSGRIAAEIHANPEPANEKSGTRHLEGVVELNHWANKVTMDIIGVAGLGRDFNTLYNSDDPLINTYESILEPTTEKALYFGANLIFPRRLVAALPWKLNKILNDNMDLLRGTCRQLVRDKKALMASSEKTQQIDILSLLIQSNNFADEGLVDQLLTFLAAGHETTSSVFTWCSYLMAANPKYQTRLREEVRAALPSPSAGKDASFDLAGVLDTLPLLNAICNETLRLYPTVPTTMRMAMRDTTIGDQFIPAGTKIYLSPWGINRSPHIWGDDANDFVPERWIDAATGKANNTGGQSSNYSVLTFLHGPRSCIGEKFAKGELRALMAVFVGGFEMEMADLNEVPVVAGAITTKPRDGMRLRLKVLDGW